MKKWLCCYMASVLALASPFGRAQGHAFTVQDDIAMVRFNSPSALAAGAEAQSSPDGRYVVVLSSRGLIASDETESVLSLYRSVDVLAFVAASAEAAAPPPRTVVRMKAVLNSKQIDSYAAIITGTRWSLDSRYLYFLVERPPRQRRLYRVDVQTGKLTPLSPEGSSILRSDFTEGGIAYRASRINADGELMTGNDDNRINVDARSVSGTSIESTLFPQHQPIPADSTLWVVRIRDGHASLPAQVPDSTQRDISYLPEAFSISPKGHLLIQLQPLAQVPAGWTEYRTAKGAEFYRIRDGDNGVISANNLLRLKQYSLVNLDTGSNTPLIPAPQSFSLGYTRESHVVWSADEGRVLVTNTFLPLDGVGPGEQTKRHLEPCAVADVQLPSRKSSCVVFLSDLGGTLRTDGLSFGKNDDEVVLRARTADNGEQKRRYIFRGDRWEPQETGTSQVGEDQALAKLIGDKDVLKVTVRQGLNQPPTLWATNTRTGRTKKLWDPNPQLAMLQFGEASIFHWRDKTGYEWSGGLVKPVGFTPGRRYPLVVQIYNFDPNQFLTDGVMPTAFAARALASAGMVVLQVQRKLPHTFSTDEADAQLHGIESAIDELTTEGLINPKKVGIVGFSFSSWYVENALIRASRLFRAATIADGLDVSYMQYHLWGTTSPPLALEFEKIIGSKPIGDGLKEWFTLAPGFHLDQVATPLRLEAIGPSSLLGEWEIYSSLTQQNKPVDLIYFPDGQHIHQRPLERFASQQGDVDWFRFWLQGYEDPDPSKGNQYRRWKQMKVQGASGIADSSMTEGRP
jgi:hypothetical protein